MRPGYDAGPIPRWHRGGMAMRLGVRQRKSILLVHIVAAGVWLGIDVVVAVLVFTARASEDPRTAAYCYRALAIVAIWPMASAAVLSLMSGILLGLSSKYGVVRYWWVAVKLAMNLLLTTLILVLLRPGLHEAANYG